MRVCVCLQDQEKISLHQKSLREQEQERAWKQLQALRAREQQMQQMQHIVIHDPKQQQQQQSGGLQQGMECGDVCEID